MMHLNVSLRAPTWRTHLSDYVEEVRIDVVCDDEDDGTGDEHVAGRLLMSRVRLRDVWNDGLERLYDVCDADSFGLFRMYRTLFTRGGRVRKRLRHLRRDIEISRDILFLYHAVLHPSVAAWRRAVFDAAFRALGGGFNTEVLWAGVGGLTEEEATDLGLYAASSRLLVRSSHADSPYSRRHPRGEDTDAATATAECQRWLLTHPFPA